MRPNDQKWKQYPVDHYTGGGHGRADGGRVGVPVEFHICYIRELGAVQALDGVLGIGGVVCSVDTI